jgi:hypothetical protein
LLPLALLVELNYLGDFVWIALLFFLGDAILL